MKKIFIAVIMIIATFTSFIEVNAAVSGSISGGGTIGSQGTFSASISISSDIRLAAIQASISYDTSKLTLIGSSGDSRYQFSGGSNSFLLDSTCSGDSCPTGSFTIVNLNFQATSSFLPGESTSISLTNVSGSDGVVSQSGGSGSITVSIQQALSSDNSLSSLSADGTNILSSSTYSTNNSTVNISAVATDSKATISGTGVKNLEYGSNSYTITVTAENGSKRNYPITVTRNDTRSSNNNLSSLNADGTSILSSSTFSTDNSTVNISAVASDTKATISGTGVKNLEYGSNPFTITVTAENGSKKNYPITITRNDSRSQDNTLSKLTVDGTNVLTSLSFSTDSPSVVIAATATDSKATISGTGTKNLEFGSNSLNIVVTAENQTKKTYTINITRNDNRSTDSTLKSLKADDISVPGFSSTKTFYDLGETEATSINLTAEKNNEKASVLGTGNKTLAFGVNTFEIKVTAENNSVKTYTVKITKSDKRNTNSKLKSLNVDVASISFSPDEHLYYLTVENSVKVISITATPEVSTSKISGVGLKDLKVYENVFNIVVTAENQAKTTYSIKVMRKDEKGFLGNVSSNNYLSTLKIKDFTIDFDKNTLNYDIDIPLEVESILVEALPEDAKATVSIEYPEKLVFGKNIITIKVISESFDQKIYTINALRGSDLEFIGQEDMDKYFNELLSEDLILTLRNDEIISTSLLNKISESGKNLKIRLIDEKTLKVINWNISTSSILKISNQLFGVIYNGETNENLEKILNYAPKLILDFTSTSKFPSDTTVEIDISSYYVDSEVVNVYLFDVSKNKLVKVQENLVVLNGKVNFTPLAGGKYIITKAKFDTFPITTKTLFAITVIQGIAIIEIIALLVFRFFKAKKLSRKSN